jgi:SOS response regulatory protein OraA/RecX
VPWRVVPAEAVVRTGLSVGRMLDRETARALARELRRADALGVAVRALRYRDLSRSRLERRLLERGADDDSRAEALAALERAGLVDDRRVAAGRASGLAGRGFGDAAIRHTLEQEGLAADHVQAALAGLAPESERVREWLERRGPGPKTLRWLAAKGFDLAALDEVGAFADEA